MAKRVQVVLQEDILSLGKDGDVVEVAPGYARNFLLPHKKALAVTPAVMKQVEHRKAKQAELDAAVKQEAIDFQTALTTIGRFTVKKQIGEDGVLFGTVTNGDVAEVIQETTKMNHFFSTKLRSFFFIKSQLNLFPGVLQAVNKVHLVI